MDSQVNPTMPNKFTGANSRPALRFERCGLRRRALVVESHRRHHAGAAGRSVLSLGVMRSTLMNHSATILPFSVTRLVRLADITSRVMRWRKKAMSCAPSDTMKPLKE